MTGEQRSKIFSPTKKRKKKRLVIVSLLILFFTCGIFGGGRFLGLLPRYPHSQSFGLCGSPELFTVGDSDYWHLTLATCFNTEDDASQIYTWYEGIRWSGSSHPTDRLGATITYSAHAGPSVNIYTKRQVLVFDDNVLVITKHELFVETCIPHPLEAQAWESKEIGSGVVAFIKTCLR
jgi:hypothetical protein